MPVPRVLVACSSSCGMEPGTGEEAIALPVTSEPSWIDSQLGPRKWIAARPPRSQRWAAGSRNAQLPAVHWYTCTPAAPNCATCLLPGGTAISGGTVMVAGAAGAAPAGRDGPIRPTPARPAASSAAAAASARRGVRLMRSSILVPPIAPEDGYGLIHTRAGRRRVRSAPRISPVRVIGGTVVHRRGLGGRGGGPEPCRH